MLEQFGLYIPYFFSVSVIVQVICGVHAYRNGRYGWLWIILFFSYAGCLIYFLVEMLPDLRPVSEQLADKARRVVAPESVLNDLKAQLEFCDSYENRLALVEEYFRRQQYREALEVLQKTADHLYENDEPLIGKMATAHYMLGNYAETRGRLLRLRECNGKLHNQELRLLLAVTLEKLQEDEASLKEFEQLESSYIGEEARCRYAMLLKKRGETARARELFQKIIRKAQMAPAFYKKEQQKWFEIAKQNVN